MQLKAKGQGPYSETEGTLFYPHGPTYGRPVDNLRIFSDSVLSMLCHEWHGKRAGTKSAIEKAGLLTKCN